MERTLFLFFCIFLFSGISAQDTYPAEASRGELLGKSRPLRDISLLAPGNSKGKHRQLFPKEVPNFTFNQPMPTPFADRALPRNGDPLAGRQARSAPLFTVEPDTVLEGIGEDLAVAVPPDPVGSASPDHFIQMTNTLGGAYLRVYDKSDSILLEMPNLNSLWSEFNVQGFGDPIVLWDPLAERWLISEVTSLFSNAISVLVAVSETSDPLGRWLAYRFQAAGFPDYPKYGIWHDAYVLTTNETGDDIAVYALEKQAMLAGAEEVKVFRLGIPKFGPANAFQVATPVGFDGVNPPPPGSPGYLLRLYDDAWEGGQDKVELWEMHIDWLDENNSFLSGPAEISGAPFELTLCDGSLFSCLAQPNGVRLDALQDIILHRAPYLNFGSYESILMLFAVDADGNNRAGLRWMELRRAGGAWELHQEGTFAPDDGLHRFAGSIAMDYGGNILLAYTVTGPDKVPSLRFTGRRAADPPGALTVEEYEFASGLSSQSSNRWGDYAAMSVDPANGKDFWFTGEYMKGNDNWGTRIMKAHLRRDSTDAGPRALLRPEDSAFLTDAEPVQVSIRNYGLKPAVGVLIGYQVDGGPVTADTIFDTIPPQSEYLHTFSSTAALQELGPHSFLVFTSLEGDSAWFNDTLRAAVIQLPRRDVSVTDIKGLDGTICDSFLLAGISLANAGADSLFSAEISYRLNDGPAQQASWTGSLAPGQRESVSVMLGPLNDGPNTFSATASLPNGLADENPANNNREKTFTAFPNAETAVLQLLTDDYPEETSWELRDESGALLFSGGPYAEALALAEERVCLPPACYVLTLFDSFGDGLAGMSLGSFQILDDEGRVLARLENINFGNEIDLGFCLPFQCFLQLSAVVDNESAAGAGDGSIILGLENGLPPFSYSIDGGNTFQPDPVFEGLAAGAYPVIARDANQCEVDTLLEVGSCNLLASAEVTNVTEPGQGEGKIVVEVTGGLGPYAYSIDGLNFQDGNVFSGLEAGEYEVTIRDEGTGCETVLPVVVDLAVSAEETRFFGREVKVFPNPTDGYIRVEVRGSKGGPSLPLRILDEKGRVVRHGRLATYGETSRGVVSLYGLPAGTYYLQFLDEGFGGLYPVLRQH